ncbi:MAG TPA: hypothetical protein VKZ53_01380 [Candidatus Angelobacter sp.]|nr:hypothetical protein [Candidatus Angelobacter sp.]
MEDILVRIKQTTDDLRALKQEFSCQLNVQEDVLQDNPFFDDACGVEIFTDFKESVDELRQALWLYIEHMAQNCTVPPALRSSHLLRATEMLRALSREKPVADSGSSSGSFFERVHSVVDSYIDDRHSRLPIETRDA